MAQSTSPQVKPYGTWKSPITAAYVAGARVAFQQIAIDEQDIYWVEERPEEKRSVIIRYGADGRRYDLTPFGFNARSLVYDYGGGAMAVSNGVIFFSNFSRLDPIANDQRVYRQEPGKQPVAITPAVNFRYGDGVIGPNGRLITVLEDHTISDDGPVSIVSLDTQGVDARSTLVSGAEGYASPRLSPDGKALLWLTWNRPHMPWDNNELWVDQFDDARGLVNPRLITSPSDVPLDQGEAVFQPEWSPDGRYIYFVSDRNNWWQLYRYPIAGGAIELVSKNAPPQSEFGVAQWYLGMSTYAFLPDGSVACAYTMNGTWQLAVIDLTDMSFRPLPIAFPDGGKITNLSYVRTCQGKVIAVAGGPTNLASIVSIDPETGAVEVLQGDTIRYGEYLSTFEPIAFPTTGGSTVYGFYYPPFNPDFSGPADERPPLVIRTHGGPTAATPTTVALEIHYFTSRGFGVVDVNYRGSTGYGRGYRLALYGQWGIYDRDDCVAAATYLADSTRPAGSRIDNKRVVARGVSAGGYLTLVQATYTTLLKAGASYSGIVDLIRLAGGTHRFEKYYIKELLGAAPPGESTNGCGAAVVKTYQLRSPYYVSGLIKCGLIFFHGMGDKICPPDQIQAMVDMLKRQGSPVACMLFPNEEHGLRIAKNVSAALEAELYFYSQLLGLTPADKLKPIRIDNWPQQQADGGRGGSDADPFEYGTKT